VLQERSKRRRVAAESAVAPVALTSTSWTSTSWTRSTTWTRTTTPSTTWTRRATAAVVGSLTALVAFAPTGALAATPDRGPVSQYVVRALPGQLAAVDTRLRHEGTVVRRIKLINADVVRLHRADAAALARDPRIASVTRDVTVHLAGARGSELGNTASLASVADDIGASDLWAQGKTGRGIDVALIDSGVSVVPGLSADKVVEGPDLSFDGADSSQKYHDSFGHGTHLAGIIAGNDPATGFSGIAPSARIVNVKVADGHGSSDVSQVIAGIDWVVQHAHTDGLNIRVLNLSFGTDSTQDYRIDPLAYAAEQAWHAGIVVVVSAGNEGKKAEGLTDPASDPYVLAVGAADTTGRVDKVARFSSRGDGTRNPDLVAPGAHLASLRSPGSQADLKYGAEARTKDGLFRGSGTSQAAAVVSGSAALLLGARPDLSPDDVKALLTGSAESLGSSQRAEGNGLVNVAAAASQDGAEGARQHFAVSDGSGSLEASRGSLHVSKGDQVLTGERDVLGQPWTAGQSWGGQSWGSKAWSGSSWAGSSWAGSSWASSSWASSSWAGSSWASSSWG
jgi:serine protease AprX